MGSATPPRHLHPFPTRSTGTYNPNTGSQDECDCIACPANTFNALNPDKAHKGDPSVCTPCPAGSSSPVGASACTPCLPGSVGVGCQPCSSGTFAVNNTCVPCVGGSVSGVGATACTPCAAGSVADATQGQCSVCAAGTSQPATGATTPCAPCSAGRFAPTAGSSVCSPCPEATFASQTGQSSCELCSAGTSSAATGATSAAACAPCQPGTRSGFGGSPACFQCSVGEYQPSAGATACLSCPAFESSGFGSTACAPCVEWGVGGGLGWIGPIARFRCEGEGRRRGLRWPSLGLSPYGPASRPRMAVPHTPGKGVCGNCGGGMVSPHTYLPHPPPLPSDALRASTTTRPPPSALCVPFAAPGPSQLAEMLRPATRATRARLRAA